MMRIVGLASMCVLATFFIQVSSQGNPVQTFSDFQDPYIICVDEVPPPGSGWPDGRAPGDYVAQANMQMCPAHSGALHTLGCKCYTVGYPPICSLAYGGDAALIGARLEPSLAFGFSSFVEWCDGHCVCTSSDVAAAFQEEAQPVRRAWTSTRQTRSPIVMTNRTRLLVETRVPLVPSSAVL